MNVKDTLITLDDKDYIKLGANKGSGFVFCGQVKDCKEYLQRFDAEYIKRLENQLHKKQLYLLNINGLWRRRITSKLKEYAGRHENDKNLQDKLLAKSKKLLAKKWRDREIASHSIANYKQKILSYTPINERPVLEMYKSLMLNEDYQRDIIIIYEGNENIPVWDLTEFRHGVGKEEEDGD